MPRTGILHTDTIAAIASGQGRAGVAVIRVSGSASGAVVEALTQGPVPAPRQAALRTLVDPRTSDPLDRALVLWFPGPGSFTGEDVAEFQVHGGRAVMEGVLDAILAQGRCRMAEPGEFARRAFDAGKLDLAEVEGLADLIAAETSVQRRQALGQLGGGLSARIEAWRQRLVRALAHVEAAIDFADEELPDDLAPAAMAELAALETELRGALKEAGRGERVRDGLRVAILGAPNAGKSSLLNALARREVAIVSDRAGTTRDAIEVAYDLGGWPVVLVDTAGLHSSDDVIEVEGMRRAAIHAAAADVVLTLVDGKSWPVIPPEIKKLLDDRAVVVATKADLGIEGPRPELAVSSVTGQGIDALVGVLVARAKSLAGTGQDAIPTRARHRAALAEAADHLARARAADMADLIAEDVRLAARAIGRISGRVDVEELLDIVFAEFCLGK